MRKKVFLRIENVFSKQNKNIINFVKINNFLFHFVRKYGILNDTVCKKIIPEDFQ